MMPCRCLGPTGRAFRVAASPESHGSAWSLLHTIDARDLEGGVRRVPWLCWLVLVRLLPCDQLGGPPWPCRLVSTCPSLFAGRALPLKRWATTPHFGRCVLELGMGIVLGEPLLHLQPPRTRSSTGCLHKAGRRDSECVRRHAYTAAGSSPPSKRENYANV